MQPIRSIMCASGERMELAWDAGNSASLAARLATTLMDIQYGRMPHEWSVPFE